MIIRGKHDRFQINLFHYHHFSFQNLASGGESAVIHTASYGMAGLIRTVPRVGMIVSRKVCIYQGSDESSLGIVDT